MADKMKQEFYVPIVRQVALDNVPLRNGPSSQKFSEETMFIFFSMVKMIESIPIKYLLVVVEDLGILYKALKWPVLYDKCTGKLKSVCNL